MASPFSPAQWLERLYAELSSRQAEMALMESYYTGDHPLPFVTKAHEQKVRDQFRAMLKDSRSNFMRLVVDVVEERLRVEGFRLSASRSERADRASWDVWQANQMDSESQVAFVEALVKGMSYLSVWPGEEFPTIAVEDPTQTIIGYEPGSNYRRRAAALKVWMDDWTGVERANVYLSEGIFKFERKAAENGEPVTATGERSPIGQATPGGARMIASSVQKASQWRELEDERVANPFRIVPIVPLRNRPRLLVEGESEIADVYRVQNQINGFLFLLALAGYFGAHRQRWAAGVAGSDDPDEAAVPGFDIAVDRLITSPDNQTRFGDFEATDLTGYIKAIEQKVTHIAVTTRTPKHYLQPEGQEPSGDAIKSAESGLVKKVERKHRPFGEGLEEALRLARLMQGDGQSPPDSEIVWADPEIRTEAEITDAAIKRFVTGLTPWSQTMTDLGYSQTQIARMLKTFGGVEPTPQPKPPTSDMPPEAQAA